MINLIIPAYNCSDTLPKTLQSLQAQTKNNFITTIVDDCSTEDLLPIIESFRDSLHINYIRKEKNEGPGLARQTGFESQTMCDYVMFVDGDDMLYPRAVEILHKEAKRNFADVVFSNIQFENDDVELGHLNFGKNTTWFHGKIYNYKFLKSLGIDFHNVNFRYNEDAYFNLIVTLLSEKKYYIDEATYYWRNNKNSLTRKANNFIYDYNIDYLMAQVDALNFIFDKKPNAIFNIAPTILNIYGAYEMECIKHPENIEKANEKIYNLFQRNEFINLYNTAETMSIILTSGKQGRIINKDLVYYRHSFSSFSDFFGITLGVEE